ncbi:MAG: hypothetical protein JJU36_03220 [Phycisphaeraceae bacterium]|nr:hypothetical protein [Phycisphaeraceae bacterium]
MTPCIVQPDLVKNPSLLGGKAAALYRLGQAGFSIPPWFVVLPPEAEVAADSQANGGTTLMRLEPGMQAAIQALAVDDSRAGCRVAVRSSAMDEDGTGHSFAGQFQSVLGVDARDREALYAAIESVWNSGQTRQVGAYRQETGASTEPVAPAVLIQRMVRADRAGVAFSSDPVTGQRGVCIVSAVFGLADQLVEGASNADTWRIDREGRILDRSIASKQELRICDDQGRVVTEALDGKRACQPSLSDDEVREVADLARRAARYFGRPQDIEWATEGDTLYLLQSRPITTLRRLPDPDGALNIWDNSNIAESYSGVTTPMTFSFARYVYEHVYRRFCRMMGVADEIIEDRATVFANMLGLVRGRIFYNLLNWYRLLAMLPGFAMNRRFMEQMMGVKEGLPDAIADELIDQRWAARWKDMGRFSRMAMRLIAAHWTIRRRIGRFHARLDEALAAPSVPIDQMRLDELRDHYRDLERKLLTRWDAPLINDFLAMIFFGLLGTLAQKWCNDQERRLPGALTTMQGDIISAQPPRMLRAMAQQALLDHAHHPDLIDLLCDAHQDTRALAAKLRHLPELAGMAQAYLEKFGDRCLEELKLESPTLHDDPSAMWRSVGMLARRMLASEEDTDPDHASSAEQVALSVRREIDKHLNRRPLRRTIFNWVLKHAGRRVRDRENLRFERTRLFGRVRRIIVEFGRRLHELEQLDDPRDVFHLQIDELLGFVEGTLTTPSLAALARMRREGFATFQDGSTPAPDDRFETRGAVHQGNHFTGKQTIESGEVQSKGDRRRGLGCCPGQVRGVVEVITDPRLGVMKPGGILVASRTDPGWVMLFPIAAGVLVEHGSLLSHSAIVAREMGIPAIVSIPGLMGWLRSGDEVEFDGAAGWVRLIQRGDSGERGTEP